jgi:TrbL/VirB6 plasmid conjugal transfer protein
MCRLRLPRKTTIVLAVLGTVLVVPRAGDQARIPAGHDGAGRVAATLTAAVITPDSPARAVRPGASKSQASAAVALDTAATLDSATAASTTASAGGACSVPGIGDIGGLLGFCSLGTSGLVGDLNNICQPSLPDPEPANSGIDAMIAPPASGKSPDTLYQQYGVAGDYWAATNLQCSDMTSLIGNNVAGMVFDAAKSIDRLTITVYQSAAGEGILGWLQKVTDRLITSLGHAIYFPYLAIVVVIGAIWLAWQGLIRKRGTRTIEGTVWMVVACAAAILLIGKPADVTGLGKGVSDGMSQALNAAFAKLPSPGPSSCVPLQHSDPQAQPATYNYTSGGTVVDQNADELWTVLVCKPWLDGEFGTSVYAAAGGKATAVNTYGRSLLWAQAIAADEKPTQALISAKQSAYAGIASSIQTNDPAVYPLFQGKQWTSRLEIAFAALFAAVVAGVLVLLISVTLILLKLGFLLLLIVGPFFLLIGTHPGFGRVVALRWLELLIGVLLKQAAVAVVLSVLLYCYALIMGTSDAVLPWALKILMIALVTVAAFIYRKPFQHLFSAVGYGVIGSHEQAAIGLQRAGSTARANTVGAATMAVPPFAAYRVGRWARRNPAEAAGLALGMSSAGAAVAAGMTGTEAAAQAEGGVPDGVAAAANVAADGTGTLTAVAARARGRADADGSAAAEAPPLNLRARNGTRPGVHPSGSSPASSGQVSASSATGSSAAVSPATAGSASMRAASGGSPARGVGPAIAAGQARGTWPAGRSSSSRPPAPPPRQAASSSRPPAPPPREAGSSRLAAPGPSAGPPPASPATGQFGPGWTGSGSAAVASQPPARPPAAAPPRRPGKSWTRRQESPPMRQQSRGQARGQARQSQPRQSPGRDSGAPSPARNPDGRVAPPWQGQPMAGPLSGRDAAEPAERATPFWLRSIRRK